MTQGVITGQITSATFAGVKNIQYGSITITATTQTATITAVDLDNTILIFNGCASEGSPSYTNWDSISAYIQLTNTTTVTATRDTNTDYDVIVKFCVLEFNDGVLSSTQQGVADITGTGSSETYTITSVDTDKAALFYLGYKSDDSDDDVATCGDCIPTIELTSATTLTVRRAESGSGTNIYVGYQVVEFN